MKMKFIAFNVTLVLPTAFLQDLFVYDVKIMRNVLTA